MPSWSAEMDVETDKAAADGDRRVSRRMGLVVRGKRDVKPVLVKIAIALALSFAGFIASQLWRRPRLPIRPPCPQSSSSGGAEPESSGKNSGGCLQEELRILKSEEALGEIIDGISTTTMIGLSPAGYNSGDDEGFLLHEFNDFVMQEFEVKSKELETSRNITVPEKPDTTEEIMMEQEIASLRERVLSLREKERSLELRLLDYQGVKEQEAAVGELEKRLKISAMEAKLYILKIDSLLAENQRLKSQLSDYSRVISELDASREKIKHLKKKMESDRDEAKGIIASLHQRINSLQHREQKDVKTDAEIKRKLKRLEELEDECIELRTINSRLVNENSCLSRELETAKMIAPSVHEDAKTEGLEEANHLRKVNDKLMEDIEQLQTDRCTDVEELVYLRWVNACLRYELRNYQPPLGKTVARDLSKCLSPKSEEKAKQLILEYANFGADEKSLNLFEVDSECSSSSQASAGEPEDTPTNASSAITHSSSNKLKLLSKLKKLVLGNGNRGKRGTVADRTPSSVNSDTRATASTCSIDDAIARDSYDSSPSRMIEDVAAANLLAGTEAQAVERQHNKNVFSQINSRHSWDIQRMQRLDMEEAREEEGIFHRRNSGTSCRYKKISLLEDTLSNCSQNNMIGKEDTYIPEKADLKKFADALRSSRGISKSEGRSASSRY
ncbi:protein CHUP1, chloroplastic-like [Musa troglodytarum]|uniref:Protein CHUP1, chloroplastic-like n=1 Tax=Musa troglodytarum TaxID=320322 RepID=A0A9E7GHW6_9LILI|nr:protein CHUP1, chloroplastic-like [Musa troglodytarum]